MWQLGSFSARLLFLLFVLPFLPSGELARYLFITSVAVLCGRVLLLGLDGELPLVVRGEIGRARAFFPLILVGWCLLSLIALTGTGFEYGRWFLFAGLLGLASAIGLYLGGIIRTISPADFERLQNVPWIIFGVATLSGKFTSAADLTVLRVVCLVAAQVFIVFKLRVYGLLSVTGMLQLFMQLRGSLGKGWDKLISNLTLVGIMRGFILWPAILPVAPVMDDLAFAVACGEALWQLGMVFAHRRYAHYSTGSDKNAEQGRGAVSSSVVLVIILVGASLVVIGLANAIAIFPKSQSVWLVSQAAVFYPMLCGYCVLRFLLWSIRKHEWLIIAVQVGIIILQGILVFFVDSVYWMSAAAIATFFGLIMLSILTIHATSDRNKAESLSL